MPDGITPKSSFNTVSSGSNQGLYAEIVPMTMQVIASRPGGASANITRKVEVALIPVFQFGVFCGYDCSYFPGPDFSFGGRVHTNQNLFLASGGSLVFNDKISAYQQIITDQLENGHATSTGYGGTTYRSQGQRWLPSEHHSRRRLERNCVVLPERPDASWSGGYPTIGGAANGSFPSLSSGSLTASSPTRPTAPRTCSCRSCRIAAPATLRPAPIRFPLCASRCHLSRLPARWGVRGCTTRRRSGSCWLTRRPTCTQSAARLADGQDYQFPTAASPQQLRCLRARLEYFGWATPGVNGWVNPYTDAGLQNWTATGFPLIGELTSNPTTLAQMSSAATGGPWIRVEY